MMQGKIYHMKNPLLVLARNVAMNIQIFQETIYEEFMIMMLMMKCRLIYLWRSRVINSGKGHELHY